MIEAQVTRWSRAWARAWSRTWASVWYEAWHEPWPRGGLLASAAVIMFCLGLGVSWTTQHRLDALLDRVDARAIDAASGVLDELVARQGEQLASTVSVLSEDARVRAMVLTPTFDRATVLDLLSDLKTASNVGVLALLDADGAVSAVVGAPELDRLDLGTSSLVQRSLQAPSSQVWAFDDKAGVLAVSPVRVDDRVRAFFLMGIELEDSLLQTIERTLGATGAIFVGERLVASARRDTEVERALRAAPAQPLGASVVANVAWLVPSSRQTDGVPLTRALLWLPALLVGLVLAALVGLMNRTARRTR